MSENISIRLGLKYTAVQRQDNFHMLSRVYQLYPISPIDRKPVVLYFPLQYRLTHHDIWF